VPDENPPDYWNDWRLDPEEFNRIIDDNSNALSAIFGYVAEERMREMYLEDDPAIEDIRTPDDQDESDKGDWAFTYKGEPMKIEVKSLQSRTVPDVDENQTTLTEGDRKIEVGFHLKGSSDPRDIEHDGETYSTVLMDVENSDIDIIAVNLYEVKDEWDFAFVRVTDLPRSKGNYPEGLRQKLSKSQPKFEIPVEDPYTDDLSALMDEVLQERN
jgi:hypothetical protein